MRTQLSILQRPYPAPQGSWRDLMIATLYGGFVACFLLFFRPFGLNEASTVYTVGTIAGFGLISAVVVVTFLFVLPNLIPSFFQESKWTVGYQILFYLIIVFVISTANGLYINYLNDFEFSWSNYGWIIVRTFPLAIIPITFIVLLDYNRKLRYYVQQASSIATVTDQSISSTSLEKNVVRASSGTLFDIELDHFLFAKADGNYVRIHYENDEQLHRITLKEVEQQLPFPYLLRCHRSYVVNLRQVEKVSGNAQGLQLQLKNSEHQVPVSRKYVPTIKSYFD